MKRLFDHRAETPFTSIASARGVVWLLVLAVLFRSTAAIFAKLAALFSIDRGLFGLVWNPWFFAEMCSLALQSVAWTLVLRHRSINSVYPYNSLVFVINLSAAHWLFNETITLNHIIGTMVIAGGVLIMVIAPAKTEASHA